MDSIIQSIKDIYGDARSFHSIIVSSDINEYSYHLKMEVEPNNLRSISKIIVALCYGIIFYEHRYKSKGDIINLNTKIWPIINKKVNLINKKNINNLQKVTFKHLFTHTTGYDRKLLFSEDIQEIPNSTFLQILCDEPLVYEPGEHFIYSNASAFILSVIFQEIVKQKLSDFAYDRIFSKMGISSFSWKDYGEYCAGATGLSLFNKDLHKIGKLLLQKGLWNNEQIVPNKWIDIITTPHCLTLDKNYRDDPLGRISYGLFTWICNNGDYFIDGKGGQFLIVSPRKNIVVTTFADTEDSITFAKYLKLFFD